jgi:CoA:oxalate CoA-transferase
MRPLENVTVIDLTRILAGPFVTMILADFGANVIKVEQPGRGDDSRSLGPHVGGESAYFMSLNRGKKSVTLNLQTREGIELLKEMINKADVLIENYRPGTMEKWGLAYEEVKESNPRLIYASISGFGQNGPYKKFPAYDIVIQGMSGLMSITGQQNGPPTRVGTSVGDIVPGLFATIGIMMALYHRNLSGEGQRLDIGMLDSVFAILENAIARYQVEKEVPKPIGNRHPAITPFDSFSTKDGFIIVAAGNQKIWEQLCNLLQMPELLTDPRFIDYPTRHKNEKELKPILDKAFANFTMTDALKMLGKAGIPCGPVNSIARVMEDPQIKSREMLIDLTHPVAGILKVAGIPIKMSSTPGTIQEPAPLLGQHTDYILKEFLGKTQAEIDHLRQKNIL